jgi:spore coat protein CotH
MKSIFRFGRPVALALAVGFCNAALIAQQSDFDGPPPFGLGGFGGPMQQDIKLVKQFDQNANGRLDTTERSAARVFVTQLKTNRPARGPMGRPGFPGRNENQTPPQPGAKIAVTDVKPVVDRPLYDAKTMRTLFLDFAAADWEKELSDFHGTDVEVPAKLTVDGKMYPAVGVHFRGQSSFMMVGEGRKRSLNVSVDYANDEQRLYGYRTLNLLNSHEDPTFLRTVLYFDIAREYLPAPKANFTRVVINGENWGGYVNVQQFNKDFVKEWFGTTKGARWKVPGSPMGRGGLEYLGDNAAAYKKIYEIKSKDEPKAWADLMQLCRVLNETPADKLEAALTPLLDVDGALKFLALENALINNDGYWVRASDYSIYQDVGGKFHIIPHDANETFSLPGGPGFGGGRGGRMPAAIAETGEPSKTTSPSQPPPSAGGMSREAGKRGSIELDPLVGLEDVSKPLRSKLLAVPAWRARYLAYVRDIAERWLDWNQLAPRIQQYQTLIATEGAADTRKLSSTEAFFTAATNPATAAPQNFRGPPQISLRSFAEQRRAFLLNHPEVKAAGGGAGKVSPAASGLNPGL